MQSALLKCDIFQSRFLSVIVLLVVVVLASCSSNSGEASNATADGHTAIYVENPVTYTSQPLPEGLEWVTNTGEPLYSSSQAEKGGTYRTFVQSFPLTLRTVGPDSNTGIRSEIFANQLSLTGIHPNTEEVVPGLATHWAYDQDGKTVYYKLNPKARWSDGKPVTADDFLFAIDFMRSEYIVSPWHNKHYTEEIVEVVKYDDHTISVTGVRPRPRVELHYYYDFMPKPRHFHRLDENWITDYNWRIEPNTGAYQITKINKGKYVEFSKKKDWWGEGERYNQNRFNVDKVHISVIRDIETAYRHFLKGELDAFPVTLPSYWHEKTNSDEFKKGYIHKLWFYNDLPRPSYGMYLNQKVGPMNDINVRKGLAHSMNFDKMIGNVLRGDYVRLHSIDTGYGDYTNQDIKAREFDLGKADSYFRQAGWSKRGPDGIRVKDGRRLSFKVTYGAEFHADRLVVLKEEAKKAGVELVLEQLDSAATYKKIWAKKHEIAWMGLGVGFRPQYWGQYHSDNADKPDTNNVTATADSELDELIEQYRTALEDEDRASLARQIQGRIHELAVVIPRTMAPYTRAAYWRWMKLPDVPGTRWTEDIFDPMGGGLAWIDRQAKKETLEAMKAGKTFEPVERVDTTYKTQ